jgi:hypothetical protein
MLVGPIEIPGLRLDNVLRERFIISGGSSISGMSLK